MFPDSFKILRTAGAAPDRTLHAAGIAFVPGIAGIMIGPHQIKTHIPAVRGFQETVIQAVFQKRSPVVPVPVIDKYVHTVAKSFSDLKYHHAGIRFILIPPERLPVPEISVIFRCGILNRLPFSDAFFPEDPGSGLISCIRRPDIGSHVNSAHVECIRQIPK